MTGLKIGVLASAISILIAGGGWGLSYGVITQKVADLQSDYKTLAEDHDTLIEMQTKQKEIEKDVDEIKGDVKEVLKEVRKNNRDG